MYCSKVIAALAVAVVTFGTNSRSVEAQTLVAPGSSWRYNDSGSNLGTAWRAVAYNDASWPTGLAQLGYGDGDETTVLSYGSNPNNRRITYYFRRSFSVTTPASISALTVRFVRDDGLVIYLNGVQVVRSNMPTGTITYTTRATTAIGGADESAWQQAAIDPSLLVAGTNVLAVELHQQSPTSTDISFDLELTATQAQTPAPTVSLISPANHGVSNTPDVTFSASVAAAAGLVSARLFVGAAPRTVVFTGPQIEDAQITADTPASADGSGASINVDGLSPHAHGLMKFPALVGTGGGQVPPGAIITSAMLQLNCTNPGNTMALYRLTESWVEDEATWNERSIGSPWASAGADGTGSRAGVSLPGDCTVTGQRLIDITLFVQEWASGALNHGMVLTDAGTDGIDFGSSESGTSPVLTVTYRSSQQPIATTPLSGPSALVSFPATLTMGQTYVWNVQVTDTTGAQSWAPADFDVTVDASSPDEPVLVSPANGSTGVDISPTLSAQVSDPAGGPLDVNVALRRAAAPEFTIIALPDTQHYSEAFPAVFTSQTQWIVDNKEARNIVFVTHEGDIVEHNSLNSEWLVANDAMSRLDGHVPYGMGPGNHDQPTTLYNQYFPYTRYQNETWYGGHFQNLNDNNFQLFSGGGLDFVIVHLQFCPPAAAVSWASDVFASYPDRVGIMTTHGYLGLSAQRSVHVCGDTQYLWNGLAVPNPNLRFMLSGHVHGESRRVDTVNGNPVFQMLADYQDRATGGEGWLRILRFVPAENRVYVQTYSPWLNRFETDADSEFTLDFPMGGAFADAGSTTAASGSTASIAQGALSPFTQYEWRMTVTNSSGRTRTGPVWTFTTGSGGPANQPPTATSQSVSTPEDSAIPITLGAVDPEGGPLTYTIVSGPSSGTLSGSAPALTYQPAANTSGTDSFTFRASDGQATSNLATVSIAIQAVNDPPSAVGEAYTIQGGGTLAISAPGLLSNDTDIDSGTLTARLLSGPAHGTLALGQNGSFSYTPSGGYSGPDSFTYVVNDGQADSEVATVSLTVTPTNAPPTVAMVAGATPNPVSGSTTALSVLGADDGGEASLTYTWATTGAPPAAVAFNANGTNAARNTVATFSRAGSYSIQVTIRDAGSLTATSIVTVTVSQTLTSIVVTPPSPSVAAGGTQLFSATSSDQFGVALSPQAAVTWVVNGGGTIGPTGLFTAGSAAGGPFTVTATNGSVSGAASVTVTAASAMPSYVQGAAATNDAGASSISQVFPSASAAGHLIVAAVSWDSDATVSCSDSRGNAYVVATTQYDSSNDQSLAICYAVNATAGANTVTANFSGEVTWRRLAIHEYSGVALTNPVDVVARNVANGTTAANAITSTAAVTTSSGDLIFAAVMADSGTTSITAGTGFTQRLSVNNKDLATEDRVQPTAGSIAGTQTFGAARRYLAQMVAFKRR